MCVCVCVCVYVYVCVWLTCYGWNCFGLLLTPTPAPLRFLLQAVPSTRAGESAFSSVLPSRCPSLLLLHFTSRTFLILTRLVRLALSVALTCTHTHTHTHTYTCSHLTLITKLTGSCFISHVVVSWQPMSQSALDSVWWQHEWRCLLLCACVCVCSIMNEL